MALSTDLISQFAKITKDDTKTKRESTIYGTIVRSDGTNYVRFDGSDLLTPATMTVDAEPGERVSVLLKDHTATVTGNISSPAVRKATVNDVADNIADMGTVLADTVKTKDLEAHTARIDELEADNVTINGKLTAQTAEIGTLKADNITINNRLTANEASIKYLDANIIDTETLNATYANIDFANIGKAAMEHLYAKSGLIEDVVVGDGTITGHLVGVTISGDLIEANTLVADKLVIKGEDGLYYKLNTDGVTTEAEQTDHNSLNGTVIKAKSITATKISVSDLVAFDATIGGFNITDSAIYSGVKESVGNTTRGIYLDKTGQIALGDSTNFLKYFKDTDGTYKLDISAGNITLSGTSLTTRLTNAAKTATNYMSLSSADGLVVGDHTGSALEGNIQLKADTNGASIALRDGSKILTKFSATSKTFSGITSAKTSSSSLTETNDSEAGSSSQTITYDYQTVTSGQTANVVRFESDSPIYFSQGMRTNGVTINDDSLISNVNMTLNGKIFDAQGRGVVVPNSTGGNLTFGHGRYAKATANSDDWTILYGNQVMLKAKKTAHIYVDGYSALQAINENGNMTLGWHLRKKGTGHLNLYSGGDINLIPPVGKSVISHRAILPVENATFALGKAGDLGWSNIYLGNAADTYNGLRINIDNTAYNLIGRDSNGRFVIGNNDGVMHYHVKDVNTTTTGNAFKFTSGNDDASNNSISTWFFGASDDTSRYVGSYLTYNRTYSGAANMHVTSNGVYGRSTSSSRRYKTDIVDLDLDTVKGLYELPVRKFKYNADCLAVDDERYGADIPGFIAEEVVECLPIACDHIRDENGDLVPEMWNSKIIIPALLKLIQDLNNRVKILEGG